MLTCAQPQIRVRFPRRLDGRPCGVRESLIRTLTRIIEANPLLFGGLPAGIVVMSSERRQRLGDTLAGTIVIKRH
jgi:uncharacterized RDD family membrane protein YckC